MANLCLSPNSVPFKLDSLYYSAVVSIAHKKAMNLNHFGSELEANNYRSLDCSIIVVCNSVHNELLSIIYTVVFVSGMKIMRFPSLVNPVTKLSFVRFRAHYYANAEFSRDY